MIDAEKNLLDRFYQEFWMVLVITLLLMVIFITLTIFYFIKVKKLSILLKIITPITCALLVLFSLLFGNFFMKYYADYKYLKGNSPIQVEGIVVDYSITISDSDLTVAKSWPVIAIDNSDEKISLNIIRSEDRLKIDEIYKFIYLPNTKIAEIIEAN